MPRRPPPSPLTLKKGPIPPRGAPRHQLPIKPCAALIISNQSIGRSGRDRERSVSISSESSASSSISGISSPRTSLSDSPPSSFQWRNNASLTNSTKAILPSNTHLPNPLSTNNVATNVANAGSDIVAKRRASADAAYTSTYTPIKPKRERGWSSLLGTVSLGGGSVQKVSPPPPVAWGYPFPSASYQ